MLMNCLKDLLLHSNLLSDSVRGCWWRHCTGHDIDGGHVTHLQLSLAPAHASRSPLVKIFFCRSLIYFLASQTSMSKLKLMFGAQKSLAQPARKSKAAGRDELSPSIVHTSFSG